MIEITSENLRERIFRHASGAMGKARSTNKKMTIAEQGH